MSNNDRQHLQLVGPPPPAIEEVDSDEGQLAFSFEQSTLVMILVDLTNASEAEFLYALDHVQPDIVVDLRVVPRFDFGRLNRPVVFRMFEGMSARYYDLAHTLGAENAHSARLNPAFVAEPLAKILQGSPSSRRVLVLLSDAKILDHSLEVFPQRMPGPPKGGTAGGWKISRLADCDL